MRPKKHIVSGTTKTKRFANSTSRAAEMTHGLRYICQLPPYVFCPVLAGCDGVHCARQQEPAKSSRVLGIGCIHAVPQNFSPSLSGTLTSHSKSKSPDFMPVLSSSGVAHMLANMSAGAAGSSRLSFRSNRSSGTRISIVSSTRNTCRRRR